MFKLAIGVTLAASVAAGCVAPDDASLEDVEPQGLESAVLLSQNGLKSINGLTSLNGLKSINGLSSLNGLKTINGLASAVGPMTTAEGRTLVSYIVRCALPAGRSLDKQDQYGTWYNFPGALGLAPGWEDGATTQDDRYWVSSCLMAHINTTGQNVDLFLTGEAPVGWGRDTRYSMQEGTFMGDLFTSPPVGKYCTGRGYGANVVAGRIGANQTGTPYSLALSVAGSGRCDHQCVTSADVSGYYDCAVPGHPITVWRGLTRKPTFDFETSMHGFTAPTTATTKAKIYIKTGDCVSPVSNCHGLAVEVTATGAGTQTVTLPTPSVIIRGQPMILFIKNTSGTNWNYAQAYVRDGPGKNYRWTQSGYTPSELGVNRFNSAVVDVPADYSASDGKIGFAVNVTGPGTATFVIDAFTFGS